MRILYVLTSLGIGGAEKLALALSERMAQRGHAVALLILKPAVRAEWPAHVPRIHLDISRSPSSALRGFFRARRFAAQFAPDVIHSHSFHANMLARLLRLLGSRPVVISTVHNVYEGGWARMMAYRFTDGLSRRTLAVSRAAAERFLELKAVSAPKCGVIVNGIDTVEFTPDAGRRARLRTERGLDSHSPPSPFLWLAAGRIAEAKDYPNLLHAFAQVFLSRPNARLWIAGEAAGTDLARLQSLAAQLSLNGSLQWLGLRRDIGALLDTADAFVSASAWEGMPLAVGEAMAMEKPVVATDVGGVRELVGDAGILVPAGNSVALARAMLDLMDQDGEQRSALGRSARQRIVEHFSMDVNADRWEALYEEMLRDQRTEASYSAASELKRSRNKDAARRRSRGEDSSRQAR
jgi:glycosyltransferase involved in cell wall biosynthesis